MDIEKKIAEILSGFQPATAFMAACELGLFVRTIVVKLETCLPNAAYNLLRMARLEAWAPAG